MKIWVIIMPIAFTLLSCSNVESSSNVDIDKIISSGIDFWDQSDKETRVLKFKKIYYAVNSDPITWKIIDAEYLNIIAEFAPVEFFELSNQKLSFLASQEIRQFCSQKLKFLEEMEDLRFFSLMNKLNIDGLKKISIWKLEYLTKIENSRFFLLMKALNTAHLLKLSKGIMEILNIIDCSRLKILVDSISGDDLLNLSLPQIRAISELDYSRLNTLVESLGSKDFVSLSEELIHVLKKMELWRFIKLKENINNISFIQIKPNLALALNEIREPLFNSLIKKLNGEDFIQISPEVLQAIDQLQEYRLSCLMKDMTGSDLLQMKPDGLRVLSCMQIERFDSLIKKVRGINLTKLSNYSLEKLNEIELKRFNHIMTQFSGEEIAESSLMNLHIDDNGFNRLLNRLTRSALRAFDAYMLEKISNVNILSRSEFSKLFPQLEEILKKVDNDLYFYLVASFEQKDLARISPEQLKSMASIDTVKVVAVLEMYGAEAISHFTQEAVARLRILSMDKLLDLLECLYLKHLTNIPLDIFEFYNNFLTNKRDFFYLVYNMRDENFSKLNQKLIDAIDNKVGSILIDLVCKTGLNVEDLLKLAPEQIESIEKVISKKLIYLTKTIYKRREKSYRNGLNSESIEENLYLLPARVIEALCLLEESKLDEILDSFAFKDIITFSPELILTLSRIKNSTYTFVHEEIYKELGVEFFVKLSQSILLDIDKVDDEKIQFLFNTLNINEFLTLSSEQIGLIDTLEESRFRASVPLLTIMRDKGITNLSLDLLSAVNKMNNSVFSKFSIQFENFFATEKNENFNTILPEILKTLSTLSGPNLITYIDQNLQK